MRTLSDFERFARMLSWSAALELGTRIKDVRSGFATREDLKYARRKVRELYQFAKFNQVGGIVLPILREGVRKYRR